ncbi:MAG: hypothetical protein KF708_23875 [Pirellulales bacterium]|nr:hypothetical protein [Pirellulales bacterium]
MSRFKLWGASLILLGVVAAFTGCKKPEGTGSTAPPATAPAAEPGPAPSGTTDAP